MLIIKTRQQSWQKDFYRDLILKLDRSSTQVVYVENYEIRNSRSNYTHILEYLCRVSFLITLDIYKDYFKGHHTRCKVVTIVVTCIVWSETEFALVHLFLCRSYYVFTPRVLWPRISLLDKLKNFAANIFLKLVC